MFSVKQKLYQAKNVSLACNVIEKTMMHCIIKDPYMNDFKKLLEKIVSTPLNTII